MPRKLDDSDESVIEIVFIEVAFKNFKRRKHELIEVANEPSQRLDIRFVFDSAADERLCGFFDLVIEKERRIRSN